MPTECFMRRRVKAAERDLSASLICDYFKVCLEQQCVDLSGLLHNNSVFQPFFNGEMKGGESIRALESMAAN